MKKISIIVFAAVLVVFSLSACVREGREDSLSTTTAIQPLEETTDEHLQTENETKSTTAKNMTANRTSKTTKRTTSTTMQKATTATNTTAKPTTTAPTTETTVRTTTTMAQKTTRTATEIELETLYNVAYNKVMTEYYKYQASQSAYINELKGKIADKEAKIDAMYAECQKEMEKYDTESPKTVIYNTYQNNTAPLREEISELKKELEQAEADYNNSGAECEALIEEEFLAAVEEFQQNTLS